MEMSPVRIVTGSKLHENLNIQWPESSWIDINPHLPLHATQPCGILGLGIVLWGV
jgi:hypothetical protein